MFYHIRHFTLLCLPKGCLLRSNRLSLKKSLEEATEELRRLWKGQLWRESVLDEAVPTRRAGAEQSSKHRGGYPVGFAQSAAVVGYLELGDLKTTSKS